MKPTSVSPRVLRSTSEVLDVVEGRATEMAHCDSGAARSVGARPSKVLEVFSRGQRLVHLTVGARKLML